MSEGPGAAASQWAGSMGPGDTRWSCLAREPTFPRVSSAVSITSLRTQDGFPVLSVGVEIGGLRLRGGSGPWAGRRPYSGRVRWVASKLLLSRERQLGRQAPSCL